MTNGTNTNDHTTTRTATSHEMPGQCPVSRRKFQGNVGITGEFRTKSMQNSPIIPQPSLHSKPQPAATKQLPSNVAMSNFAPAVTYDHKTTCVNKDQFCVTHSNRWVAKQLLKPYMPIPYNFAPVLHLPLAIAKSKTTLHRDLHLRQVVKRESSYLFAAADPTKTPDPSMFFWRLPWGKCNRITTGRQETMPTRFCATGRHVTPIPL